VVEPDQVPVRGAEGVAPPLLVERVVGEQRAAGDVFEQGDRGVVGRCRHRAVGRADRPAGRRCVMRGQPLGHDEARLEVPPDGRGHRLRDASQARFGQFDEPRRRVHRAGQRRARGHREVPPGAEHGTNPVDAHHGSELWRT
jgi:hypothetical protein